MKKRALQVRLTRVNDEGVASDIGPAIDPEQINEMVKDQVLNLVVGVGVLMVAKKSLDTVSELILIAGRKYI